MGSPPSLRKSHAFHDLHWQGGGKQATLFNYKGVGSCCCCTSSCTGTFFSNRGLCCTTAPIYYC